MKRALIVGINYEGTQHELRGCINDALNIEKFLLEEQKFDEIKLCLEAKATTKGILEELKWLVTGVVPGDVIVFHYSGHGSQIRSEVEPDGLDEIICPVDLDWKEKVITDKELKQVFQGVPNGVNITAIFDCCHSGNVLDQNESYMPAESEELLVEVSQENRHSDGSRFLPMPADIEHYIRKEKLEIRKFVTSRDVNRSALLIATAASHQTAADAFIQGMYQGAGTAAMLNAVRNGSRTYKNIANKMVAYMVEYNFTQRPQLDGHPSLYDQLFLQPWGSAAGTPEKTPEPGNWVQPLEVEEKKDNRNTFIQSIALACVILLSVYLLFF